MDEIVALDPLLPPRTLLPRSAMRFGLCCQFADQTSFRFRTTTVAHLSRLVAADPSGIGAFEFYRALVEHNLATLEGVLAWCDRHGVAAFRIGSDLWPRATHPLVRPWVDTLFADATIVTQCARIREFAREHDIRLSEHPDQFLVGNSLRPDVVRSTVLELEWRAQLGSVLGVDVLCIHVGSGAPDAESALWRWEDTLSAISTDARRMIAFENDDRTFTPEQILPACLAWDVPLVYDAHHHRVNPDSLDEDDATLLALATWGEREPHFHLSSPREGWDARDARPHHDVIDIEDWPTIWTELLDAGVRFTVDIEAKGKERAIFALRTDLFTAARAADESPTMPVDAPG